MDDTKTETKAIVVTTPICCVECNRLWLIDAERWRMKLLDEEPPEAVPYCPDCHCREFGI